MFTNREQSRRIYGSPEHMFSEKFMRRITELFEFKNKREFLWRYFDFLADNWLNINNLVIEAIWFLRITN